MKRSSTSSSGKPTKMIILDLNEYRHLKAKTDANCAGESLSQYDQDRARIFADKRLSLNDKINLDSNHIRNNNRIREETQQQQNDEISKIIEKFKMFALNAKENQRDVGVGDHFAKTQETGVGSETQYVDAATGMETRKSRADMARRSLNFSGLSNLFASDGGEQLETSNKETPVADRSPMRVRASTIEKTKDTRAKQAEAKARKKKGQQQKGGGLSFMRSGRAAATNGDFRWLQMKFY